MTSAASPSPTAVAPAAEVVTPPSPLPTTEVTTAPEAPVEVAIPAFPSLETLPSNFLAAG